jgi:hypothetical protein
MPVTAVSALDVQVTTGPAAAASGDKGGVSTDVASTSGPGVVVNTIRNPNLQVMGLVAVLLPKGISTSGSGTTVAMPDELRDLSASSNAPVRVTQPSGASLPAWIRYAPDSKSLVLGAVPQGGLPLQVMMSIGSHRVLVQISESQVAR